MTESDHLTLLIENVLQLSRAEDVVVDGRRSLWDLRQLAEDAVARLKVRWEDRTVQLEIVPDVKIECDGKLVTLALANLLDNAAKYGNRQTPIRLCGALDRTGVFLSVVDRGRGIPAADQSRIFQRFYRASNSADSAGMGLGLFLVQRIAQLHNGRVEFSSQEGVGSTFTMKLPVPVKERGQETSEKVTNPS
jgi:signal transduction histidine kinase